MNNQSNYEINCKYFLHGWFPIKQMIRAELQSRLQTPTIPGHSHNLNAKMKKGVLEIYKESTKGLNKRELELGFSYFS